MKTRKTMIATVVAMLFTGMQPALAATHEDEWQNMKLCGDLTIAADSVSEWGCWNQFEAPAAGPPSIALLGPLVRDSYRPVPTFSTVTEEGCAAGAWCGYVAYRSYLYDGESSTYNRPQAGLIQLWPNPDDPMAVTIDGGEGYGEMRIKITPMAGSEPLLVIPAMEQFSGWNGVNLPVEFGMDTTWVATRDGLANFYGSDGGEFNVTIEDQDFSGSWSAGIGGHNRIWARGKGSGDEFDVTPYMTMGGNLYVSVWGYINGRDGDEFYYGDYFNAHDGAEGYVAGIPTPLVDMNALRSNNITASYAGFTSAGRWTSGQSPVAMTVQFGNGTWNGSWNNGYDGNMYLNHDSSGRPYIVGQIGLTASGTVTGANFQSTTVGAHDGNVSGSVQGTFYGPGAAGLGGIVNVTKTSVQPEGPAITSQQGYTGATYVDVFAASKVPSGQ